MKEAPWSLLTCIVNSALSERVGEVLEDLGICSAYIQRGKQLCLEEKAGRLGLAPRLCLVEDRAEMYRFAVPHTYEAEVAGVLAESADLYLPGRGSIYAETLLQPDHQAAEFENSRLSQLPRTESSPREPWSVICCVIQRGLASELAKTLLEMGLCVPVVSFASGVGLRDRLGLLRITIPVEKEVLYILVPEREAQLAEGIVRHKGRLNLPGMGFIYRQSVLAYAINRQISRGRKAHMASMDQVIAALDEMRGSSDWRRMNSSAGPIHKTSLLPKRMQPDQQVHLSILAEEERAVALARMAMDNGAGGATLLRLLSAKRSCAIRQPGTADPGRSINPGTSGGHDWGSCELVFNYSHLPAIQAALEQGPDGRGLADGQYWLTAVEPANSSSAS